jgi:hypothetical protein
LWHDLRHWLSRSWWFSQAVLALIVEKRVRRTQRLDEGAPGSQAQRTTFGCVNPQDPEGEEKMGDDKKKDQIVIKSFIGDEHEGKHLVDCYFVPKSQDTFDFFDKEHKEKKQDVRLGEPFSFDLDLHRYTLTLDPEPDKPGGYWGPWRTGADPAMAEGTYQAEAGGSGEEEEPNRASAGGY